MQNTINQRVAALIKKLGLNQNSFASKLETSSSRISNITTGRNAPDSELLRKILEIFTNVNIEWLLTGEGEMLKNDMNLKNNSNTKIISSNSTDAKNGIHEPCNSYTTLKLENDFLKQTIIDKDRELEEKRELIKFLQELLKNKINT